MTSVEMWILSAAGAVGYAATMLALGCCLVPALGLAALIWTAKNWPAKTAPGPGPAGGPDRGQGGAS